MTPSISYVLPVHNNASTIESVVRRILERVSAHPGSEVILIENASTDDSAVVSERLADTKSTDSVRVLACRSPKGIGSAWRVGIPFTTGDLVVLTASDLPFGFTDLDRVLSLDPMPRLAIGSKAHPWSLVEVDAARQIMSRIFRVARGLLLGLWQGDTQGSLLIQGRLVRELLPELGCADYLIATEVIAEAVRAGVTPVEVPIEYRRQDEPSTVSPVTDSMRMLAGLLRLRRRLRRRRLVTASSNKAL